MTFKQFVHNRPVFKTALFYFNICPYIFKNQGLKEIVLQNDTDKEY